MERSEWPDDDALGPSAYPPAPLPPHERAWRHPSELGSEAWSHLEPPLTLGRGLLVATGAIGGLLSLAVLWAMLPSAGGGGAASPTVVSSTANDVSSLISTGRADTLVATSVAHTIASAPTTITAPNVPASVHGEATSPTEPAPTGRIETADPVEPVPVAVGVGDSMVITTARAAEGRSKVTVTGADGQRHDLDVLMVDRDLGVAVLASGGSKMTASYGIAPAAAEGDAVTVLSALPISTNVRVGADGRLTLDAWADSIPEGTPVVNANGLLIGMCSHGASGPVLVSVTNIAAMMPAKQSTAGPYVGVHVIDSDRAGALIDGVDPNGPAAAAGVVAGDLITAVDGAAVTDVDGLKAAIAAHVPTDVVTITVARADQTSSDIAVTLTTAPTL